MGRCVPAVLVVRLFLAADCPKGDPQRLQGIRAAVSIGNASAAYIREANARMAVEGQRFTLTSWHRVAVKGTIKLDPTKTPKEYDSVHDDGKHLKGVYELEGDKLRLCIAAPGADRPNAFETKRGDPLTLVTYERPTNEDPLHPSERWWVVQTGDLCHPLHRERPETWR